MAGVRLLRQSIEQYGKQVQRVNADYAGKYDDYVDQVNAWNTVANETPRVYGFRRDGNFVKGDDIEHAFKVPGLSVDPNNLPESGDYLVGTREVVAPPNTRSAGTTTTYGIFAKTPTNAGPQPEAPTEPNLRAPNITEAEYAKLKSPPSDQAGVAMANAKGYTGVSDLAAENVPAARMSPFTSAFTDPADPGNIRQRGVLARTLAGQLG